MLRGPFGALTIVLILTGCALSLPAVALAQAGRGEISGEVHDLTGSVVPAARVVVTEIQTNQVAETRTSRSGTYTIPNLKPGIYRVVAESQGFKRFVQERVQIATGEKIRLDVNLAVGDLSDSDSITVTSDAPLLRTESGSLGQVVNNRNVVDLPLNGRSFVPLVSLAAGVANPPGSSLPRINGGRPRVNEYLFDGISVLQPEPGQVAYSPVIDAIQEFKVESNSPPAEFG